MNKSQCPTSQVSASVFFPAMCFSPNWAAPPPETLIFFWQFSWLSRPNCLIYVQLWNSRYTSIVKVVLCFGGLPSSQPKEKMIDCLIKTVNVLPALFRRADTDYKPFEWKHKLGSHNWDPPCCITVGLLLNETITISFLRVSLRTNPFLFCLLLNSDSAMASWPLTVKDWLAFTWIHWHSCCLAENMFLAFCSFIFANEDVASCDVCGYTVCCHPNATNLIIVTGQDG